MINLMFGIIFTFDLIQLLYHYLEVTLVSISKSFLKLVPLTSQQAKHKKQFCGRAFLIAYEDCLLS